MNVAELLVRSLEKEGVTKIFGVPGEENEDLLFAIADSDQLEFVPCRHEQGAAFIANVWGRLTGQAGVCLSTLGPGATNLMTGIADANLDKAPVVAITGQGDLSRLHHESHQLIDVVQMFAPITKWNAAIKAPEVVTEIVRKAFKLAEMEKPGATHIELSEDLAKLEVPEGIHPLPKSNFRRPAPEQQTLEKALKLLYAAAHPIILVGNGAIRNRISQSLTAWIKQTNFPVVATFMGKGAVSDQLPQSLLAIGLGFKDYVMEAMEKADLVMTIGYDIAEYSPEQWNPDKDKTIIHVDFEPAEVYQHYLPTVEMVGDITLSITAIAKYTQALNHKQKARPNWYAPVRKRILDDIASYALQDGEAFTVPGVLHLLRSILQENDLVISDVGAHKMWIARNFPVYCANGCIISNGLASMGIALPGGIAAALTEEDRHVVCLMGDGGFMMNMQELETAKRLGLAYTIIVFNDNDYGLISWKQSRSADRTTGTKINNPDFVLLGESFGIPSYCPQSVAELKQILEERIPKKELTLIEVPIDPSVNQGLVEKLNQHFADPNKRLLPHPPDES